MLTYVVNEILIASDGSSSRRQTNLAERDSIVESKSSNGSSSAYVVSAKKVTTAELMTDHLLRTQMNSQNRRKSPITLAASKTMKMPTLVYLISTIPSTAIGETGRIATSFTTRRFRSQTTFGTSCSSTTTLREIERLSSTTSRQLRSSSFAISTTKTNVVDLIINGQSRLLKSRRTTKKRRRRRIDS